ncbi:hypothetical protein BO94DRAFT_239131 [Aspergillus sclerotioniger CBS 115572]|uniref:Uncharacterized protein n=1 Tax=Aspergillus sclerotioniger CBS 115572 TaxID=1450535 RepID=A0A317VHZ3_9EURO|nr:hypothetical protein BO94DRAFT_239131 [Aspergillus sclerotioniger CBS 115572]PWY73079.1 hypothetical protein BO94DRAFT_239131 [Aspergillus sclerotioniger CBS 115572]
MPPSQNISRPSENITPNEKSQYRLFKDAGFNGMHDFMLSYGLKPSNFEDYDGAHQIIDPMRRYDQEHWEAEHNERNQDYSEDGEADTSEPSQSYCEDCNIEPDKPQFEIWEDGKDEDVDKEMMDSNPSYDEGHAADQSEPWQSHYDENWEPSSGYQDDSYENWNSDDQYENDYE